MSKQMISLEIKDRSLTKLAGNSYGRKLFDAQVDGHINLNDRLQLSSLNKLIIWHLRLFRAFLERFIPKLAGKEWKRTSMLLHPRFLTRRKRFWIG